ncbi:F-box/kelch-repeat protein At3g23880-like [Rhododendron vialii]|uniref:F-box/kelch-repeat protein At3g23880-like n=1 Tax=Rhododendron vialii TaxID=182163 RepID=UPI00265DD825|nr:F-box/kelch-repeat protein At3g23880-like [Rhododendron vialii]
METLGRQKKASRNTRDEAKHSFPNIPEEIILQILPRLPLHSLSRFQCVSKKWRSLISDISARKRGREMFLVFSDDLLHSIDLEKSHGKKLDEFQQRTQYNKPQAIYGSCHGLLLVGIDGDFFLWNPLTSYFKKVLHYDRLIFNDFCIVSGLCYDSSTDEYKVVMVLVTPSYPPVFGSVSVVVGSFRSKKWTNVGCSSYFISSFNPGPTVNELLHWYVAKEKKSEYSQIVYFNPQMGSFREVPMPQPKQSDGDVIYGLGVLDGCLCMSRSENLGDSESNNIEVLAMKEYGVAKSWTSMFIISNFWPSGYTKNGEAFALRIPPCDERKGIWHISLYNPVDNSTRDIPIPTPMPTHSYNVGAIIYEESLVKPTDYLWEDEELRDEATYEEYFLNGCIHKMKIKSYITWRTVEEGRE